MTPTGVELRVAPGGALSGSARVPGDKSIGHRALLLGALSSGTCRIGGLSGGLDQQATIGALRALGVEVEQDGAATRVSGVGLRGLQMPRSPLDCANSGTTLRLLCGLLAPQGFGSRLVGDASLSRRPMRRIVEPLRARGAHIAGTARAGSEELYPPIAVAPLLPDERLAGIEVEMPVASAQVKSALLLSGLYAAGPTALREPTLSRDHTERMLLALGVPLETFGPMVVLDPKRFSGGWDAFDWQVPGDPSSAAFLIAAALVVPRSDVLLPGLCLNPTRTGLLDVLRTMGANLEIEPKGDAAGIEPVGDVRVAAGSLRAGRTGGELVTRMIDEVPALCAIAACARGTTLVADAAELRVKESDRVVTMAAVLRAFGVECEERPDGLEIHGGRPLRAARVSSGGDHRVAMAAAVLALGADGESVVEDAGCIDTSFPGFDDALRRLGASVERREAA